MKKSDNMRDIINSLDNGELVFFLTKKNELKPDVFALYVEEAVKRGLISGLSELEQMEEKKKKRFLRFFKAD